MNRDEKAATIDAARRRAWRSAEAIIAVDYRGITVPRRRLRSRLRDADATFRVVKNSLTERAADQAGVRVERAPAGPTALTFVRGDAAIAAKAIADPARATELLPFKGGVMGAARARPASSARSRGSRHAKSSTASSSASWPRPIGGSWLAERATSADSRSRSARCASRRA